MSVPKSERAISRMEFIAHAEKIAADVARFSLTIPKRYTFVLSSPLVNHAEEMVFCCNAANQTYVNSQSTFDMRRQYLNDALNHLLHVETLLGIIFRLLNDNAERNNTIPPNNNVFVILTDAIDRERKLIAGYKRSDTIAFNNKKKKQEVDNIL